MEQLSFPGQDDPSGLDTRTARWHALALYRLCSFPGVGPTSALRLARQFSSGWEEMAAAPPRRLAEVAPRSGASALAGVPEPDLTLPNVNLPEGSWRLVGYFDDDYPAGFRDLPDAPAFVWVRGPLPTGRAVAVVGTRKLPAPDRHIPRVLGARLAEAGAVVISGLALGVDTAAHEGALDGEGVTAAILGSGIDVVTPASNRGLAERILESGGALISEQPPGTQPSERTLVPRNRLQAALSRAVIIAQCGVPSGTLHTARFALEQGRVLAVVAPPPGRELEPSWDGNRALIDPAGCDPQVLRFKPTSPLASRIKGKRPVADVVLHSPDDLAVLLA